MRDRNRENIRTKHSYQQDFGELHPHMEAARSALIARWIQEGVNASRASSLNRVLWRLSHARPGIAPNDYTIEMALEDRRWLRENTAPGYYDLCVLGQRALFDELIAQGTRRADLGNPFAARPSIELLPPALPEPLATQRAELLAYYEEEASLRDRTQGEDGYSQGYARHIIRYFDGFLSYIATHNANPQRTSLPCPLALPEIFGRYDLAAEFLRSGRRFDARVGELAESSRRLRKNALLAVRRYAQWRGWIDCPDYQSRLNDYLRGPKGKARLGGRDAAIIEALSREDIQEVRALLAHRRSRAERALTNARTEGGREKARARMIRQTRQEALFEIALCGIRVQGIASLDARELARNDRGSITIGHVRAKSKAKTYWRRYWASPRAYRAFCSYFKATGRSVPLAPGVTPDDLSPRILIKAGEEYAATRVAEDTIFVPVFLNEDGTPMTVTGVQTTLRHLLAKARCAITRPHVMRHCAADIAINDWGMTPSHVAEVYGWESVSMVLDRYSKAGIDTVMELFDAQSEADVLSPDQAYRIATGAVGALGRFLVEHAPNVNQRTLPMIWDTVLQTLDQLAAGDPATVPPSKAMVLSFSELATLNAWIVDRSDRHTDIETLLGRSIPQGFPAPQVLPTDPQTPPIPLRPVEDDDDDNDDFDEAA